MSGCQPSLAATLFLSWWFPLCDQLYVNVPWLCKHGAMFILIGLVYLYVYGLLVIVVRPIMNWKADDTLIRFKSVAEGMDKLDDVRSWVNDMLSDMTRGEVVAGSVDDLVARSTNSRAITLFLSAEKPEKYKEAYKQARGADASFDVKAAFHLEGEISEDLKMAMYDTLFPLIYKDGFTRMMSTVQA